MKDLLPLQRLHYCKHRDGKIFTQREECGNEAYEVSMDVERKLDPNAVAQPLPIEQEAEIHNSRKEMWIRLAKWLGFALAVGIVAKILKQSFILWFILGLVLRTALVALHFMAF